MPNHFEPPYIYRATVHRVVDADTIVASVDVGFGIILKNRKVRLAGINAKELSEPGGKEAKAHLESLITDFGLLEPYPINDDVVLLIATKLDKNDKYGRILGTLRGFDQTMNNLPVDINAEMIHAGYATEAK